MVDLVEAGVILIFVGLAIVVLSMLFSDKRDRVKVKGGGVLMIGPIPIIFGSDAKWTSIAIVLATILVLVSVLLWKA